MRNIITQSIVLPAAAESLFAMYLDASQHAAFTGSPVVIEPVPGAEFCAFDGVLSGTILAVVTPILLVQSWRSAIFRASDPDSTLVLSFTAEGKSGRIDLVHVDVPDHDYAGVSEGWEKYYWTPWRKYLAAKTE